MAVMLHSRSWNPRWLFLLLMCLGAWMSAEAEVTLLPAKFQLRRPGARQHLILERTSGSKALGEERDGLQWESSRPDVVRIEAGDAIPLSDGTAILTCRGSNGVAQAEVEVTGMGRPVQWSFRNDVQPVLAKAGCSSGACHGAAAGQGGFKLSLRGYDNEGDFRAVTRSALGRRIDLHQPHLSLLLLKPTVAVPHKGGERFSTNSLEYQILSEWIGAGTPAPTDKDSRIQRLEIMPSHVFLQPGQQQQFVVRAHFSNGDVQDVTRWVKFTDANSAVTSVGDTGLVKIQGYGEGAITAWYLSRLAVANVTVPYSHAVDPKVFAEAPRRNFIDNLTLAKLEELQLPPSPRCSDAEFIRRAFLDTVGTLPSAQEVREFLKDSSKDKRDLLIESLLSRPAFVDYWTYKWSDLLLVNGEKLPTRAMWSYHHWIRESVAANKPWDQLVREIVTASGSNLENGAANFFLLHDDPTSMAETTTQAFLGMSVNCAKCHNHPMEKWTNDEYFGFANLFARVRMKNGAVDGEKIVFPTTQGDLIQPLRGRPQTPRPLDGPALAADATEDRRVPMARWLTSRENPYFTRSIVNRVWANFYGVGLVDKVDDLRVTNPSSHEALLQAAATYLADHHFDLKALMRVILQSETYQRASEALPENQQDSRFYSHYYPRRLSAEVLLDAFSQVTETPTEFRVDLRNQNRGLGETYPVGVRALQLPDTKVFSYFLKTFGRPEREKTCECERSGEPNMAQALHLANGDTVNRKLASKTGVVTRLMDAHAPPEEVVESAYLSSLSRLPDAAEKQKLVEALTSAKPEERRAVTEDVFWAVLSSKEFLYNH